MTEKPLSAELILASFGSTKPYKSKAFDLSIKHVSGAPRPAVEKPLRYGKLPEIHHIFRPDPKSPPVIITLVFAIAALAAFPALGYAVIAHAPASYCGQIWLIDPCSGSRLAPTSTISRKQ